VTDTNKKKNILEELSRAEECLRAADLLCQNTLYADAVSRLYYYVFHAVRALLLARGLEPKSHEGTLRLLSMHFGKPGIIKHQSSHIFARLMKYRAEADYNPSYVFLEEDYRDFKKEAEELVKEITDRLSKEGLL